MHQVARVEVDAERRVAVDRVERALKGDDVIGDLGRVHLQPKAHALSLEDIEDRRPACAKSA